MEEFNFELPFDIKEVNEFYFPFSHTFLFYEGNFYYSEIIDGTSHVEDLPIIKRNIKEFYDLI